MVSVKKSYVYILINHDKTMYKIGRTDNIQRRILALQKFWGKFQLHGSYAIKCDRIFSANLEKMLHYLVSDTKMYFTDKEKSNGHSEFFDYKSFHKLKKFIKNDLHKFKMDIEYTELKGIEL